MADTQPVTVHPTAIVGAGVRLGAGVRIGPYCVVDGPDIEIGDEVVLQAHVVVQGRTRIGRGTRVFPFAALGTEPQDLKYRGEPSELVIGEHNRIREHVTMNPGTEGGGMVTRVGDHCLFMVGAHVAHDCRVGSHVILANNATLAGHVVVEDHVIIGGLSAVLQRTRIGQHAIIGGMSGVESDVIPFGSVKGERAYLAGLNIVGLKRRGFSREEIHALRQAFRQIFGPDDTMAARLAGVAQGFSEHASVQRIVDFIHADPGRPLCQPKGADE